VCVLGSCLGASRTGLRVCGVSLLSFLAHQVADYLKWREMQMKMNFRHPTWLAAIILKNEICVLKLNGEKFKKTPVSLRILPWSFYWSYYRAWIII
jgi:hypothetical protein